MFGRLIPISINLYNTCFFCWLAIKTNLTTFMSAKKTGCPQVVPTRIIFVFHISHLLYGFVAYLLGSPGKNPTHPVTTHPFLLSNTLVERYDTSLDTGLQMWSAAHNRSQHGAGLQSNPSYKGIQSIVMSQLVETYIM